MPQSVAAPDALENADAKVKTLKEVKKLLEERFKSGKNRRVPPAPPGHGSSERGTACASHAPPLS